jgi:hypothetical protein
MRFLVLIGLFLTSVAHAAPIHYEWSWHGGSTNQYRFEGIFSIDESVLGSYKVTEADLLSFSMEGYIRGVSQGSWSGTPHKFRFNGIFEQFLIPIPNSPYTQIDKENSWNRWGTGAGLSVGSGFQLMSVDGEYIIDSRVSNNSPTFAVSRISSVVPIPAAVWLFGSGLGLLGWMRRRPTA